MDWHTPPHIRRSQQVIESKHHHSELHSPAAVISQNIDKQRRHVLELEKETLWLQSEINSLTRQLVAIDESIKTKQNSPSENVRIFAETENVTNSIVKLCAAWMFSPGTRRNPGTPPASVTSDSRITERSSTDLLTVCSGLIDAPSTGRVDDHLGAFARSLNDSLHLQVSIVHAAPEKDSTFRVLFVVPGVDATGLSKMFEVLMSTAEDKLPPGGKFLLDVTHSIEVDAKPRIDSHVDPVPSPLIPSVAPTDAALSDSKRPQSVRSTPAVPVAASQKTPTRDNAWGRAPRHLLTQPLEEPRAVLIRSSASMGESVGIPAPSRDHFPASVAAASVNERPPVFRRSSLSKDAQSWLVSDDVPAPLTGAPATVSVEAVAAVQQTPVIDSQSPLLEAPSVAVSPPVQLPEPHRSEELLADTAEPVLVSPVEHIMASPDVDQDKSSKVSSSEAGPVKSSKAPFASVGLPVVPLDLNTEEIERVTSNVRGEGISSPSVKARVMAYEERTSPGPSDRRSSASGSVRLNDALPTSERNDTFVLECELLPVARSGRNSPGNESSKSSARSSRLDAWGKKALPSLASMTMARPHSMFLAPKILTDATPSMTSSGNGSPRSSVSSALFVGDPKTQKAAAVVDSGSDSDNQSDSSHIRPEGEPRVITARHNARSAQRT